MSNTDPDLQPKEKNLPVAIDVVDGNLIIKRHNGRTETFSMGSGGSGAPLTVRRADASTPQTIDGYIGANPNEILLVDTSGFTSNQWVSLPDSPVGTKIMVGRIDNTGTHNLQITTPDASSFGIRTNEEYELNLKYADVLEFTFEGSNWIVSATNSVLDTHYGVPNNNVTFVDGGFGGFVQVWTNQQGTVICDATEGNIIVSIEDNPLVRGNAIRIIRSDNSENAVSVQFSSGIVVNIAEFPDNAIRPGGSRIYLCDGINWWITEVNSVRPPDVPAFSDLNGVVIISPEDGQVPVYSSGGWHNEYLPVPTFIQPVGSADVGYSANAGYWLLVDASSGEKLIALPAPTPLAAVFVKKIDSSANHVVIDHNSSALIDGQDTYILTTQYDSVSLFCDGTNWWII